MSVMLHYQFHGQGKPVLILHGLFGSGRNWTSFARKLAEHFQVITIDLRNHGSSDHADSMTYTEMASDIRNVLYECGLDRASIIGHSMGGKVAMVFVLLNRSMIDQLVILDVAPVSYENNFHSLLDSMEKLPLAEIASRKHADSLLSEIITDTPLRHFLLQNLVQDADVYSWRINLDALKNSLVDIDGFPSLELTEPHHGPTMFLGGENSAYLRPEHHPIIDKYFSNVKYHRIDNAGHWLHIDQPDVVLEKIKAFLLMY